MDLVLRNGQAFIDGNIIKTDVGISEGRIVSVSSSVPAEAGTRILDFSNCIIFPGFTDVHVHLREPGFSYKETIRTGTLAAARGGFTAVCAMPNLDPVPDCAEAMERQLKIIRRDAAVRVVPYAAITRGENGGGLADMAALAPCCAGFSDDGRGVQSESVMREAMLRAKALGRLIAAHCEDERFPGTDPRSEWSEVGRDLRLAEETGCALHICHVSSRESVRLIRSAKARGVDVTAETAPHYLTLCRDDASDDGRFKMNPPLRDAADRDALVEALADGTVDMVATDHAPHSAPEKQRGFGKSLNGIVGLETAFPVLYTRLVRTGKLSLGRLADAMAFSPAARFGFPCGIAEGGRADITVWEPGAEYTVRPDDFLSMGRSTPFAGDRVFGKCRLTLVNGETVWQQ